MSTLSIVCGLFAMIAWSAPAHAGNFNAKDPTSYSITASSVMNESKGLGPTGLLTGTTLWHSQKPPRLPEWVQLDLKSPASFTHFGMKAQPNSDKGLENERAPKDFIVQGKGKGGAWENLLDVKNAVFKPREEMKEWVLTRKGSYASYRVLINAGSSKEIVTIGQLAFR